MPGTDALTGPGRGGQPPTPPQRGVVAADPGDSGELLAVTVGRTPRVCLWQPGADEDDWPGEGDEALVAQDDTGTWWLLAHAPAGQGRG